MEFESTFIEISNSKQTNIFIGSIGKHQDVSFNEFNEFCLNDLLDQLSKENKEFSSLEIPT